MQKQAIEAVRRSWEDKYVLKGLDSKSSITDCSLKYVPFWKLKAKVDGHIDGYEYDSYESTTTMLKKYAVDKNYVWTEIACDKGNIGVEYLRNIDGENASYNVYARSTLGVTASRKDSLARGMKAMEEAAVESAHMDGVTSKQMNIHLQKMGLVFYPLWIINYTYRHRKYSATVDGVTGELISGQAPGDLILRLITTIMLIGIFIVALGIFFLISGIVGYLLLLFIAGIGHGFIVEALTFIRYGSKVTRGDIEGGFRHDPIINCKHNEIAVTGIILGYFSMALSFFAAHHLLLLVTAIVGGLVLNIVASLFVCGNSYTTSGSVKEVV
jgi:hypothetical protein